MSRHTRNRTRARTTACGCTRTRTPAAARRACSRRCARCAPIRSASTRRTRPSTERVRALSRRRPVDGSLLTNGLDEGIMALGDRAICGASRRRAACPRRSFRSRRSRSSAFDTDGRSADGSCSVMPHADFAFPLDEVLAAITPQHARRLPDQPEQPDRRARCRSTAIRTIARRVPPEAVVFVDEAYAEFAGATLHSASCAAFPNVVVGRTFSKAFGLAGLRIGVLVGAPATLDPIRLRGAGLQRQHRRGRRASQAALGDLRSPRTATCGRSPSRRRCSTPPAIGSGSTYWKSERQLRAGPRRRPRRRARRRALRARGIYLRDRSTEPGCAGCIRIATGIVEHTRAVHRGDGGGPVRRARNRSADDRNADRADDRRSTARAATRCGPASAFSITCWSCSRGTARFDLTIDGDRRPRRRSAPHRRGSRHRARRGGVEGARRPARHQPRRLLRHADGRDAGGRGDRSRRPAARRRRSEGEGAAASAICRPSWSTTSSKASRSARAPTSTSRCSTAARAITRSRRCSRRSRARCASRARRTGGWRGCCRAPRGCCEVALDRLRRRQPDVGAEGARRGRRRGVRRRHAPARARRRRRHHRARRRPLRRDARRSTRAWIEAILARVGDGRPLLGICLGMQWLFEGSDEAPELPGARPAAGPLLRSAVTATSTTPRRAESRCRTSAGTRSTSDAAVVDRSTASRRARRSTSRTATSAPVTRRHGGGHRARRAVRRRRAARPRRRRAVPSRRNRATSACGSCATSVARCCR